MSDAVTATLFRLAAAAAGQLPPPSTPAVTSAKSYTVEWAVLTVLLGLTLWAVGRPSNRT